MFCVKVLIVFIYGIQGNKGVNCDTYFAVQPISDVVCCTVQLVVLHCIAKRLCACHLRLTELCRSTKHISHVTVH